MSHRFFLFISAVMGSIALANDTLAVNNFNGNAPFGTAGQPPMTTNWLTASLWGAGHVPNGTDGDINLTNQFLQVTTITNCFMSDNGSMNFLRVISGNAALASSNVTVITSSNIFCRFGFAVGSNSTIVLANTSTLGNNENSSFNTGRATSGLGTLVISNGASVFLNFNAAIRNDGTILFIANPGQNSQINYGQNNGATFTNNTTGAIVKLNGTGTSSFIGEFGGANKSLLNQGTITIGAGPFRMDPRDAFNNGGFRNTGFVQVDTGAVFEVRRTTNAWVASNVAPTNSGTVYLNGGEWRTIDSDGGPGNAAQSNSTRVVVNAGSGGVIRGNGLLDLKIRNETGGVIEARDGTLSVVDCFQNNGTWVSTNFGGNASTLNFTNGSFDIGGATLLNSNGTLRLTSGANLTLSTSYRQNWGTIDFAGVGNVWLANSATAGALTNELIIRKSAPGIAAIIAGHGTGQNNYGVYNRGTLDITGGGRFSINTSNAFSQAFQNLAGGTVVVGNDSTVRVVRTSAAWGATTSPTNSGTISLNNGVLETADDTGVNSARAFVNAGTMNGNGTINASVTNVSGGVMSPGFSIGTNTVAGNLAFGSNSTLVVELGSLAGETDLLTVGGTATFDPNSILAISGGVAGNVYTAMTFSARSGFFGALPPGYLVTYDATTMWIELAAATQTITATATGNGTIAPSGSVVVTNGNDQAFTITPDSCNHIVDVLVDAVSVGPVSSYTFTNVTADHTIDASFAVDTYTITAGASGAGSISPSGAVSVNCGDDQLFDMFPAPGYHVADVLVDAVSVGPVSSYLFSGVAASHTISVAFAIDTYDITATAGSGGTITPNGVVSVNHTNDQAFTITPDACYQIADVLVDAVSVGPVSSYTFTNVTAAHTISASFTNLTYAITASAGANGSISPVGVVTVDCGTNQTFLITEDPGYPLVDVLVDAVSVGPVSSYTFSNITANHTIDATFATNLFRIVAVTRSGPDLELKWNVAGGHDYIVESTTGAAGSFSNNFTGLSGSITIPGIGESTTNYFDLGAVTNTPTRYYRIRLLPLP